MASRDIPDGITREDVLNAIEDLRTGLEHSFGDSTGYDLIFEGERYPPKAVLGLAARRLAGRALTPYDFKGGKGSKCFRILENNGFTIRPKSSSSDTAPTETGWSDLELRATVEAYLWMRERERLGLPYTKSEVNRRLREEQLQKRTAGSVEYRMQNISAVLAEVGEPWIPGYRPAKNVGDATKARILNVLNDLAALDAANEAPTSHLGELEKRTRRLLRNPTLSEPAGNPKPKKVETPANQYERDPQVRAYALRRAEGKCDLCGNPAPFETTDGTPFLEVHHIVPLADGGADTTANTAALCPNCHRRCHQGKDKDDCASLLRQRRQSEKDKEASGTIESA